MTKRILSVKQWIAVTNGFHLKDDAREMVRLGDGGLLSIQASRHHLCDPQQDNAKRYRSIEIGSKGVHEGPLSAAGLLVEYFHKRRGTVIFARVPIDVAERYVMMRGGILVGSG